MSQPPEHEIYDLALPLSTPVGSLGRRLVGATLMFCLLFTLATVAVRTWFAWDNNQGTMNSELQLIDQVFQGTLSRAVWEMDRDALQAQLDSIAKAAPVGHVELRILRAGRAPEVLERSRTEQDGNAPRLHRELTVEPYPGASELVGEFTIVGDQTLLWRRLWKEVASIVITQVIQSLALAGLIMGMFNRSVTVHVQHIAWHLGRLSPANLRERLSLGRTTASDNDELQLLEVGVNDLQDKLATYIERQHQDEVALAASRDRLAELVQERTAELLAANVRLQELSRHDSLTGLANRRYFDEMKTVEFQRATRHHQPLAVLMCDVDFFKKYNDAHGHAMGDDCLRTVAQILRKVFTRSGELPARLGGEEFAVLLPGADTEQARHAADRLRLALAEERLLHGASSVSPFVTLSIGVAQLDPDTMHDFDRLLQSADQALYRAKSQGRDRVVV
ncbi:GGDEF domain-containing protein [Pseudomonas sp. HR96]|uniref:GGDEF domain-containing protein n=1 Tax=Pseudomonas sp. HR96 TaxID=1027966 RepID=UPI002A74F96D|nr:GGDEF domain-containing protein [Pseudomonas sp. HR96]WPP01899.1 GGDEF domain-containing protein [Pseudomonas sp. HR96]